MKTSRAVLNDRTRKKKSSFHKICTYENPTSHFESEEIHGYEYSHIRSPAQQLVFHKEEIRPTPISLPTPPASPEFWGTSLQKWYQKKPLFTLTAKGQVKRLEKYLQIQKTLEICKKEHEFQVQTENMKKTYVDFEFREHQPLLYEGDDVCCVCPCNSSRKYDVDFIPVHPIPCSSPKLKYSMWPQEDSEEMYGNVTGMNTERVERDENFQSPQRKIKTSNGLFEKQILLPTNFIKQGQKERDDRGIYKIIVRSKERPKMPDNKYMKKINDSNNFDKNEEVHYMDEKLNFQEMPNFKENDCKSGLSRISVGNISTLPFDYRKREIRSPNSYSYQKSCSSCQHCHSARARESSCNYEGTYDVNKNLIFEI